MASDVSNFDQIESMNIQLEEITPEIAQALLGDNSNNRKLSKHHVKFLSDQIKEGSWQITGDPIKISDSGRLLDGQHRLTAIVHANQAVSVFVARGVPDSVFTVLDTGKNRSAADALSIQGLKSATNQAALARAVMAYDQGKVNNRSRPFTNQEVLDFCVSQDLTPYINIGVSFSSKGAPIRAGVISIVAYILGRIDQADADEFLESLCLGVGIQKGTALYMLREKLNKAIVGGYEYSRWETVALIIKTWNLTRTQSALPSMLVYNPEREEFPAAA